MNRGLFVLAMGAALAASACTLSVGEKSIDKVDVEQQVADRLAARVGQRPTAVTCPDDLKAKVDTVMRCRLQAPGGTRYGVTVTVTSVDGDRTNFDIRVDDRPSG